MKKELLVSVIITTKNEESNLEECLLSILEQSFNNIEIIVVDNFSTDKTPTIAKKYTKFIYQKGPERSVQRNFGAEKSKGEYLLFLDADMRLTKGVISECVSLCLKNKCGGVVIPERSYGTSFWAKCKELERSFYLGVDWLEAARFYPKKVFNEVKGFDINLNGPEDWDLSQRVELRHKLCRTKSMILHNEADISLSETVYKKYYYSKKMRDYKNKRINSSKFNKQANLLNRYVLFFSDPLRLFKNPVLGIGMLFMKTSEFSAGVFGYLYSGKK